SVESMHLDGPVDRWRALRDRIHADTCNYGFDPRRGSFTQAFGSPLLDASLLLMPIVGFLPATDSRVLGTIEAISRGLVEDGFVRRYPTQHHAENVDGLPGSEG